mmetsp:Transcript_27765/g.79746  ORF Transcript_27765/g.79746 Transcript_27765/m.79746 type:complete len:80 (+) Transcript_27765:2-241(+)
MDDEELLAPIAHTLAALPEKTDAGSSWVRIALLAAGALALLAAVGSGTLGLRLAPALESEASFGLRREKLPDRPLVYHV